jgi:hypothetical protein
MFLRLLVILSLILIATGLGSLAWQLLRPPGQPQRAARGEVPSGTGPAASARRLVASHVPANRHAADRA